MKNVIQFASKPRPSYQKAVRNQRGQGTVHDQQSRVAGLMSDMQIIPKAPDPNDVILRDLEMLVAKSDALIGVERTNLTLRDRLLMVMAARVTR